MNPDKNIAQRKDSFVRSVDRLVNKNILKLIKSGGTVFVTWSDTDMERSVSNFEMYKASKYVSKNIMMAEKIKYLGMEMDFYLKFYKQ